MYFFSQFYMEKLLYIGYKIRKKNSVINVGKSSLYGNSLRIAHYIYITQLIGVVQYIFFIRLFFKNIILQYEQHSIQHILFYDLI